MLYEWVLVLLVQFNGITLQTEVPMHSKEECQERLKVTLLGSRGVNKDSLRTLAVCRRQENT